jgi:DNA-binding NarL/FixJ family response regulator
VVRLGLRQILTATRGFAVCGEVTDTRAVIEHVRREKCDVLLLNVAMSETGGLDIVDTIRRERPRLPVLALSMQGDSHHAVRLLKAGAAGYLTKDVGPEELVHSIRKVHAGGKYVPPTVAEKLLADLEHPAGRPPHETLSDREYQILRLLAKGMTGKQIAQNLYLSEKTVSTYRERVLRKVAVKSTADLIRYAIQHRLAD